MNEVRLLNDNRLLVSDMVLHLRHLGEILLALVVLRCVLLKVLALFRVVGFFFCEVLYH